MRILITKRTAFPKCIRHFKELKGICVGECIAKSKEYLNNNVTAHAHSENGCPYQGWLCLKFKYILKEDNVLLHEIAHLIINKSDKIPDHGKEWRKIVKQIGGTYKSFVNRYKTREYIDFTFANPERKKK